VNVDLAPYYISQQAAGKSYGFADCGERKDVCRLAWSHCAQNGAYQTPARAAHPAGGLFCSRDEGKPWLRSAAFRPASVICTRLALW